MLFAVLISRWENASWDGEKKEEKGKLSQDNKANLSQVSLLLSRLYHHNSQLWELLKQHKSQL